MYNTILLFRSPRIFKDSRSFLHHGNIFDKYNEKEIRIDRFELCVSDSEWQFGDGHDCLISGGKIVKTNRRFNVINLLNCFIFGTEDYINHKGEISELTGTIKIEKI